jgi:predicted nucleic acid-binding protein
MTDLYFVDTNILVYARDSSELEKQPLAAEWLEHLWKTNRGRLSYQVLQEYYQVVTRKLSPGLSRDAARQDVIDLLSWRPQQVDHQVLERAWSVEDIHGLSWWDSLIVAAALRSGARYLLTEDLQADQDFGGLVVANPFDRSPS